MNRNPAFAAGVAFATALIFVIILYQHSPARLLAQSSQLNINKYNGADSEQSDASASHVRTVTDDDLQDIMNRTLGFEKVYVVSLPSRTDRLDAFTMQAAVTDMDFTVAEGVDGKQVLDKVLPYGMSRDHMGNGAIGCWRAHLNIFQQMVQFNIQSALIFEDDADWDLVLKYQMLDVARGTRFLLNSTSPDTISPYGDDWDIMWVGNGGIQDPREGEDRRRWVTPNDPTVVPPNRRYYFLRPELKYWDEHITSPQPYTRVMLMPRAGTITAAYAISLRGAKKMLYHQSMEPFSDSIDDGLIKFLQNPDQYSNFTLVAPYPRLIASSTPAGPASKETDIEGHNTHGDVEAAYSSSLMYSARMAVQQIYMGATTFQAQYWEETGVQNMTIEEIASMIRGHGERIDPDEDGNMTARIIPGALFS